MAARGDSSDTAPETPDSSDNLSAYRAKRSPDRSPEPVGTVSPVVGRLFVVHKHAARQLHFDLRLEMDGVLRSWAVPKGPSTDPRDKRLAMEVEDHPLAWGEFEGVIESGYGAGRVIVWDRGTYRPLSEDFARALDDGHASFWLEGQKLRGGWSLRRIRDGRKPQWLLVKRRDEAADARRRPTSTQPESVVSGRRIEDL